MATRTSLAYYNIIRETTSRRNKHIKQREKNVIGLENKEKS